MEISNPEIVTENGQVTWQVDVRSGIGVEKLWYTLDEKYKDLLTGSADAAAVALLLPSMAYGENIKINGKVSEQLYYNISGRVQNLLKVTKPSLSFIQVSAESLETKNLSGKGVATGFSGGIDSFCVLADHFYKEVPEGFKVTHLLFNNVGSHGYGEARLFQKRYDRLKALTGKMGLPFISINSNVDAFYREKMDILGFQPTHTIRNVSVALLFQTGISRYIYASTFPYKNIFVGPANDIAYSDPLLLPMLSTESLQLFSAGSEYTRVQKTLRVAELKDSYSFLDICVDADEIEETNCSKCWKCMRTLLTMEIAGVLMNYKSSFDLSIYKWHRNNFIKEILSSDNPLLLEIMDFAKKRNFTLAVG